MLKPAKRNWGSSVKPRNISYFINKIVGIKKVTADKIKTVVHRHFRITAAIRTVALQT